MNNKPLEVRYPRAVRIQADAVLVTPNRIHLPGQIVVRAGRVLECSADCSTPADIELPGCMLSAGLVNAHTHLEFSDLVQPFPAGNNFPTWIGNVIRHRRGIAEKHAMEECWRLRQSALQSGYRESYRAGVALLADIVTRPWSTSDLSRGLLEESEATTSDPYPSELIARDSDSVAICLQQLADSPSVFAFPEMIGLDEDRFTEAATWAMRFAGDLQASSQAAEAGRTGSPVFKFGLSPHAPYSVHFFQW